MLFARSGDLELGPVLPEDSGADLPMPAYFRPPLPSPAIRPAMDQQIVLDPIRPSFYLGLGQGSVSASFQAKGSVTTGAGQSATTPALPPGVPSWASDLVKVGVSTAVEQQQKQQQPASVPSWASDLVKVGVAQAAAANAQKAVSAGEGAKAVVIYEGPSQAAPAAPEPWVAAWNMILAGDIEGSVMYAASLAKKDDRINVFGHLKQMMPEATYAEWRQMVHEVQGGPSASFWNRNVVGSVRVKHVALGVGVLAAIGVATRFILR